MKEEARRARNTQRLGELNPAFARRIAAIITELESKGFRPRIQDAYRSKSDQLAAFQRGSSRVRAGFHNLTNAQGKPDSLAVDMLDDDWPLNPPIGYLVALARAAKNVQCETGIAWGLPVHYRKQLERMIDGESLNISPKVGWDPCHVQPADLSLDAALKGARPQERES